jgi:hypothetical protein
MPINQDQSDWPELNWPDWQLTAETLQLWTQIVGKTRLALTPLQNHWWNVPLYVTARGLITSPMPLGGGGDMLEIEFDFQAHVLHFRFSDGRFLDLPLRPQSVAAFYQGYRDALDSLGLHIPIWPMPVEIANPIRFDQDETHASYDPEAVERFQRILMRVHTLLKRFSTGFLGKISPVHFFWGSFDLCATRFSGRVASGPPRPDPVQQEAYSHEVISAGFWPGNGGFGAPAFYCYAAPVPAGLDQKEIHPGAYDPKLGEFILLYEDARSAADPERAILDFLESSYAAAADSAAWDRAALERPIATAPVDFAAHD